MKTKGIIILFIFCVFLQGAKAQYRYTSKSSKAIKYLELGMDYFDIRNNEAAKQEILKAIEADPGFIEAYMLLGDVYDELKEYKLSAEAYKKAVAIDEKFFPNNFYTLGKVELYSGSYTDAKMHLEKYLTFPKIDEVHKSTTLRAIGICDFAIDAMAHPVPFEPHNLDSAINTIDDEYLPAITADEQTLIITRRKPRLQINSEFQSKLEEDFYYSVKKDGKWKTAVNMGTPINTPNNEGAQCISPDGQYLFFTACEREDGVGSCDIYMSKKTGNTWSRPVNMGETVNSMKWESQPSISPDGRTLYFVSTRNGGKGRMDIWKTTLGDNGNWSLPVNMGDTINTPDDEMSPFIHPSNNTLYFSSKGHVGMGGFDIFLSRIDVSGHWGKPQNLGYPINTLGDETSLIVNASGETAYFASDKLQGKGKIDIYSFDLYKEAQPLKVTYIKGKVINSKSNAALEAKFELIDLSTGKIVMQSTSDVSNGEFLLCLPVNKDYALNVSKDGYLFYSENFSLKDVNDVSKPYLMNIKLQPIQVGETVVLKNIFFETASYALKDESKVELEKLYRFLSQNQLIHIEIGGHTDNIGDKQSNVTLSSNRALAVYNYLLEKGIDKIRLSYKGYGDSKPIAANDSDANRSLNRRTDFTIIDAAK